MHLDSSIAPFRWYSSFVPVDKFFHYSKTNSTMSNRDCVVSYIQFPHLTKLEKLFALWFINRLVLSMCNKNIIYQHQSFALTLSLSLSLYLPLFLASQYMTFDNLLILCPLSWHYTMSHTLVLYNHQSCLALPAL